MNVHLDPENAGDASFDRMLDIAGSSVDVSGFRRGVNCMSGYICVSVGLELLLLRHDGLSKGAKSFVAFSIYAFGFARGSGWALVVGQSSMKPPGASDDGVTR